ncbi:MAG TPA: DUF72 domain-containing protein [Puia sp.]|nr:DUF72 domain-containing protein [Puia sp.]
MSGLWTGTSGLVLPVPNKQAFPAAFRHLPRLSYYASLLNSIEVNSSFYRIPMPSTFARWRSEVPQGFAFTVKFWRGITHVPGLTFDTADISRFLAAADGLAEKKGCLLIQTPPALTAGASDQLDRMLAAICRLDSRRTWKLAVEFRNRSWYEENTWRLLLDYQACLVLHDRPPAAITNLPAAFTALPFVYLRFHGPEGDYRGGYTEPALACWAARIGEWLAAGKEIYTYFNNTIGDALTDLSRLKELVPVP